MKKKILSIMLLVALMIGTCSIAMAEEATTSNATRDSLQSYGSVVYTDGMDNSVEIHSDDLYLLADRLDSFKISLADQLAAINTYLSYGNKGISLVSDSTINVVHTDPSADTVDPLLLDFSTLLEGVAASQSIPTDVTEYGYPEGTLLYKTTSGSLTTNGAEKNVEQIGICAATADNLSAGTSAWVNGQLIIGNGADNHTYYNLGYTDGYKDHVPDNAHIEYYYHEHTGDSGKDPIPDGDTYYSTNNPGGCYTKSSHTHNKTGKCGTKRVFCCNAENLGSHHYNADLNEQEYTWKCRNNGNTWVGNIAAGDHYKSEYTCGSPKNTWKINCGKTTSTIVGASIIWDD